MHKFVKKDAITKPTGKCFQILHSCIKISTQSALTHIYPTAVKRALNNCYVNRMYINELILNFHVLLQNVHLNVLVENLEEIFSFLTYTKFQST